MAWCTCWTENTWVVPMLDALSGSGGRVVSENRVPVDDLLHALDRLEGAAASSDA